QVELLSTRVVSIAAKAETEDAVIGAANFSTKLAHRLSAEQAGALVIQVASLSEKTTHPDSLWALALVFNRFASRLPVEHTLNHATSFLERVSDIAAKATEPDLLNAMAFAFAEIAPRLPLGAARKQADSLASRILSDPKPSGPDWDPLLVKALAKLAPW